MSHSEYQGTANYQPCQYAPLGQYTSGYAYGFTPQGHQVSGIYVVPTWAPINHDSLIMSSSCNGYPTIMNAYGKEAGSCQTQYATATCSNK
jgi:hypothetical protein